jgi:hypothetical protein
MPRSFLVLAVAVAVLALAACGESAPPPPLKQIAPPPVAPATPAAPPPEAKAPEAPKPDPNKELAASVKRALEGEAKIQAAGIDVTADDGKVTLWGTTTSNDERARAGRAAARVPGVKSVDNKLAVVRGS